MFQVIRLLKIICDKSPELKQLSSYHTKNCILNMARDIPDSAYWAQRNLATSFLDALARLRDHIEAGDLRHFLVPGLNLLAEHTEHSRERVLTGLAEEKVLDMVYNPQYFGL